MANHKEERILDLSQVNELLGALAERGYTVLGPTLRDGSIVYDELHSIEDLPVGWSDEQDGGHYRLRRREDQALFGYAVGPHSWKKYLFPPRTKLWEAERDETNGFVVIEPNDPAPRYAFVGVRACEIAALGIQDKVFIEGSYVDPVYEARRREAFVIAVQCGQAGGTCFCVSMKTGPRAETGFDLALTELIDNDRHVFLAETGTPRGAELLETVSAQRAAAEDVAAADEVLARTARNMGRKMEIGDAGDGLKELLYRNLEHPRWDDVASRCLTCANCTLVCPTCFCSTVEDVTDLTGEHAERWRTWDSCFTQDFSYIHGGSVRSSTRSQYRQWMTHKLATWFDQFGSSGCVGCGRCITWCPVAIDLTEEVHAIRDSDGATTRGTS